MAVLIDVNTLPAVFSPSNLQHEDFRPVRDWVLTGRSTIVFGGTCYLEELKKIYRYMQLLLELQKVQKVKVLKKDSVDMAQKHIRTLEANPDFNDSHLVAIVSISGAKVLCSNDASSFRFIRDARLYPKNCDPPKIYTNVSHTPRVELLCDQNLSDIDRPYILLEKIVWQKWIV